MQTNFKKVILRTALSMSLLTTAGMAAGAPLATTVNLTAQRTSMTLPDGTTVPMWGYCGATAANADSSPSAGTATSAACTTAGWAPGPTIVLPYSADGTSLTINLTNNLPVPTSMVVLGQLGGGLGSPTRMVGPAHAGQNFTTFPGNGAASPAFIPPAQADRVKSFATEVAAATTVGTTTTPGLASLTWANLRPGTYLYETGTLPSIQAPMGLYGVLIVTQAPVPGNIPNSIPFAPGKAYPAKSNEVVYDSDATLLFSEIDPVQNKSVDAAAVAHTDVNKRFNDPSCGLNCYPAAVNYTPKYFLINGKWFDRTAPQNSAFSVPASLSSGKVLLRLLNAGLRTHVPSVVGLELALVAEDGNVAPGNPKKQNEVLLTAGKTHDVLVSPAAGTGAGAGTYAPATFAVFDRALSLTSGNQPEGGMQGFLLVNGASTPARVTPTAVADAFAVPFNTSINGDVRVNDIAVVNAVMVAANDPLKGTLAFNGDGTFSYTPVSGFIGTDTFTYNGNGGTTNTATVTLNVASGGVGAVPIAVADSYTSNVATKFSVSRPGVLANDTDPTGYPLTASLVASGNCTSVSLSADGSFVATSSASSCQFTYVAKNSQGSLSLPVAVNVAFGAPGTTTGLKVAVVDAKTGAAITDYRWIIQEDLTFKHDIGATPSLSTRTVGTSFHKSHMPVVATGCVGPISCGTGQQVRGVQIGAQPETTVDKAALDPNKNYYISVLPGDAADPVVDPLGTGASPGHMMGGSEIKAKQTLANAETVTMRLQASPLVPAQLSVFIYEDNAPINNQNDLNETGLGGFNIILMDPAGRIGDVAGQQTYDAFNMPLTNALLGGPGCPDVLNKATNGTATSVDGNLVGVVYTCPNAPPGYTGDPAVYTLAGHALIKNLTPARYDVIAHPAAARQGAGEVWWQTETLEGTPAQDAFTGIREPRYFQEFGPPGFHTTIGFVNPANVKKYAIDNGLVGTRTITGKVTSEHMSRPSDVTLYDSGSYDLLSSTTCQVALNSQGGNGPAIAIAQCDKDGNFTLSGVPSGDYELAIWDQWLDQIIQFKAVTVGTVDVALGNIPVLSWFTQYDQNIFMDTNKNGVYDPGESGISNLTMTSRYRNGAIHMQTATDSNGNGLLAEMFPLFNWYVVEADTTRFKQTGVNIVVDGGGKVDASGSGAGLWTSKYATGESSVRVEQPGAYSYGLQSFVSQRNTINWGRAPYAAKENGGIQGTVVYSSTRPFDDQRYNVQNIWAPLVPRVTVNLYRKEKLADGTEVLKLMDTTQTSSWDDYVNAVDANGIQKNMQCPGQLPGPPTTGAGSLPPFDLTAVDPFVTYTLAAQNPGGPVDRFRCYDGFHNWNQVQAAPYDGRYQFPSAAYVAAHPLCSPTVTTNCTTPTAGQTLVSLPAGQYVVEAVTPAGYEIVKEEDKNILIGDAFIAPAVQQFGPLGSIFILPDQATLNNANPYNPGTGDPGFQTNPTSNLGVTASQIQYAECVGNLHRVPDFLSIYPQAQQVAPFAGMDRPLCDRKLVNLGDKMQASANFFTFTPVPVASNNTGIILDDASAEFNAASPDFGEKAAVPFAPVSIKDFNGLEITRTYSDQWGAYNVMTPSSWLVNPPTPSGYGPNMLITCMNDPGPIAERDASGVLTGRTITDPAYNPAYSHFCYTNPFMPGLTTYLDTPVLPIAAFAGGYNPADCEYPNATPAIARVDSSAGFGPYLPAAGGTLTITALGDRQVQNPAYAGPFATSGPASQKTVTRHYGFGGAQGKGSVSLGGVSLVVTNWGDASITVTVPANTPAGELVITADNGKSSVDVVTVTLEDRAPVRVQGSNGGTIQAAIEAANPGDLILVDAGTYNELVIMWKPVRLQGVGAASVIINAAKYPNAKLEGWRSRINDLFAVDINTGNVTGIPQIDPLPTQEITGGVVLLEPSVLGTEEGPGIAVLGKNPDNLSGSCKSQAISKPKGWNSNFGCYDDRQDRPHARIDGLSVTGGDAGGGIYVNGWAHNLEIANNRVYGNAGALNGGIRVGVPYLELEALPTQGNNNAAGFGYDRNLKIHHNAITKNGTVEGPAGNGGAGGGLSICTGTDGYRVDHNWICGNISASDGGGIGHIGFSQGGSITNNTILFNQSFQQTSATGGGGIVVTGEPAVAGTLSLGTGNLVIDSNLIRGNFAEGGHGGGIRLQQVNGADVASHPHNSARWHDVTVTNNMIVDNVAGYSGGGISLADTVKIHIANNTVAANDSAGIAGVVLAGGVALPAATQGVSGVGKPSPAGISSETTSAALLAVIPTAQKAANAISNPRLVNNIVWKNRSFFYSGNGKLCVGNSPADLATCIVLGPQSYTGEEVSGAKYWDLGVVGDSSALPGAIRLDPTYSVLDSVTGYPGTGNTTADPKLVDLYFNGSRMTPEFGTVINPPSVLNLQVAATVDEGNNYVNLRYGPLYLAAPAGGTATRPKGAGPFGDYHIDVAATPASSALDTGTTVAGLTHDFDNDFRPQGAAYDIGADEVALVRISPTSLSFGNQQISTTSAALTVTVQNLTATPLSFTGAAISGTNASNFAQTNTCGLSIAANGSCTISVTFTPTALGIRAATLTVTDGGGVQTVALAGTGVAPSASGSPTVLAFGNVGVGQSSASQPVTLTNTGVGPLGFTNVTFTGFNNANFTQTNNCPASLAVGANCTINVTFTPSSNGTRIVTMNINDAAGTQTVSLSGTGLAAAASRSPAVLAFGNVKVGTASVSKPVTLTNTGIGPLGFTNVTFTGLNNANFTQTNNCAPSVAVGASCTINVTFTPSSTGIRIVAMNIIDAAGTQTVGLAGNGVR